MAKRQTDKDLVLQIAARRLIRSATDGTFADWERHTDTDNLVWSQMVHRDIASLAWC